MPNRNDVTLVGHLTRDAELRFVGTKQTALLTFGIAVTRKYGEKETTGFFDCKAWGSTAEGASSLRKGDAAIVVGELTVESWDDKGTGQKRSKVVIQADVIGRALYQKKGEPTTGVRSPASTTAKTPAPADLPPEEDDVPFATWVQGQISDLVTHIRAARDHFWATVAPEANVSRRKDNP